MLVTNNFTRNFGAKLYKLKALTGAIIEDEGVEQKKIVLLCDANDNSLLLFHIRPNQQDEAHARYWTDIAT